MAFANKTIRNPKTGQEIKFLITGKNNGGELLEMESTFSPFSKEPPPHYHPIHVEDFTVLSGQLTVRIDGQFSVLKKGDKLHIPKNKVHSMWNDSKEITIVNWKARPALNFDHFLETATGLAISGKTNKDGKPGFLQSVMMANEYSDVFRLSSPPYAIQKILFTLLTPIGYLFGYRGTYKEFLD